MFYTFDVHARSKKTARASGGIRHTVLVFICRHLLSLEVWGAMPSSQSLVAVLDRLRVSYRAHCLVQTFLLYVILHSVMTHSASRTSRPQRRATCIGRCVLLSLQYPSTDLRTCRVNCQPYQEEFVDCNRTTRILDVLGHIHPTIPCRQYWKLKYKRETEHMQVLLPEKRRWGNTIAPCISAHCTGLSGRLRVQCIVSMCNRSRRSRR